MGYPISDKPILSGMYCCFGDMDVDLSLSHQVDAVDGDGFRSQDEMETPSA